MLAILGFVLTIGLQATGAYLSHERRKVSLARVAGLDVALANYVAVQGRLPCPCPAACQFEDEPPPESNSYRVVLIDGLIAAVIVAVIAAIVLGVAG